MYGIGIWRGLNVTLKRFVSTYVNDLRWLGTKQTPETFAIRQGTQAEGLFTVEYPDEKIAVPERFRFVPFLVVNNYDDPHAAGQDWCTSCGICAKVCPPQCIWIVRGTRIDPKSGRERPKPEPDAFFIDIDICMNCGLCAEYCPFDAIKMDHDYELASYDRTTNHIYDKDRLSKEVRYWQTISPQNAFEEAQVRGQWEHKDTAKLAKKAGIEMTPPEDWDNRVTSRHNPEIANEKAAPVAAPQAGAPSAAPQAVSISLDVDGASPDQLAEWAGDEGLPLAARSAAAVKLDGMIRAKEFKPSSDHRKAISAAKKAAKEADTTINDAASGFTAGEVVASVPAAVEAAPIVEAVAEVAETISEAVSDGPEAIIAEAKELEAKGKAKEIKLTSENRKFISQAKKLAKENGIEW